MDVLSTRRFYAHMLSYFSFCFFLDTFLAVAVDCAVDNGISRVHAAHVLTFFSITDMAGRLLIPLITDYKIASPLGVMTLSYFLIAIIGMMMPYAQSDAVFWILVVSLGPPVGYVMVAMSQTIACDVGVRKPPYGLWHRSSSDSCGSIHEAACYRIFPGRKRIIRRTFPLHGRNGFHICPANRAGCGLQVDEKINCSARPCPSKIRRV
ncbi:hypothetical protein MTO96_041713 [Rhipicephalus appendiculatus]